MTLHIGRIPGRRQVALYDEQIGQTIILAYFRSVAHAQLALAAIDKIAGFIDHDEEWHGWSPRTRLSQ